MSSIISSVSASAFHWVFGGKVLLTAVSIEAALRAIGNVGSYCFKEQTEEARTQQWNELTLNVMASTIFLGCAALPHPLPALLQAPYFLHAGWRGSEPGAYWVTRGLQRAGELTLSPILEQVADVLEYEIRHRFPVNVPVGAERPYDL
jgi:hypothetical protein